MHAPKSGFFILIAALALPLSTHAQSVSEDTGRGPAHVFGNQGELALSSDAAILIDHSSQGRTRIQLAPALDYFIIKNLSIGGTISLAYTKFSLGSETIVGIGPRVGYNLMLSDLMSIWPKIGFSYTHSNSSVGTAVGPSTTLSTSKDGDAISLNLFVPFMFHPAEHFFVGLGPFLDADLSGSNKVTVYGIKLTLGGWL
jgi:hypothetical protein